VLDKVLSFSTVFYHNQLPCNNNNNNQILDVSNKYNDDDVRLTNLLLNFVKKNYPFVKEKQNKEKDYEEMNKLQRLDNFSYQQIEFVINWCQQDEFWKQNIRSVFKLREKFEELVIRIKAKVDQRKVVDFDK